MRDHTKFNRRDFMRWSALVAGATAVSACAPTGVAPAAQQEAAPSSPGKATIRFMTRAPAHALPAVQDMVENQFMVDNPTIEVIVEPAPSGWTEKLLTAMIAGDAQDVFEAWPAIWHEWVERDLVLDLQPYVDKDMSQEEVNDFIEAQWEAQFIRGTRVGLPLYIDMRLETYNKDLFDEFGVDYPPEDGDWDWMDLTEMARKLTQDRDGDGQIDLWGAHLERGGWFYWPRMFGGDIVNPDDNTDCWLDHPGTLEAYNWIWENQWGSEPNVFARPAQVENQWYLGALTPEWIAIAEFGLYPGETAVAIGDKFRWDYAHIPKGPVKRESLGDADGWSIWNGSQQPDAAWQLLRFLTSADYQEQIVVRSIGYVPIRKSLMPNMLTALREEWPSLQDVRLEVIPEAIEWGYLSNVRWFKNNVAAEEIINPALDLVFVVGEQDPSYFAEVAAQVEATQT
jgi:multiple sugar transport system substrate-binding protein